jgi:hypothetical protein
MIFFLICVPTYLNTVIFLSLGKTKVGEEYMHEIQVESHCWKPL